MITFLIVAISILLDQTHMARPETDGKALLCFGPGKHLLVHTSFGHSIHPFYLNHSPQSFVV